jgi:hypothetical protein
MTYLNNEHLLVSFGDTLLNRYINKDDKINIPKQLLISKTHSNGYKVDISSAIGLVDITIKDDGIYYTPKIFNHYKYISDIIEFHKRDVLQICGGGSDTKLESIAYFYISIIPLSKEEQDIIFVTECDTTK